MWTECPQVLDAPVTKYGFELSDLLLLGSGSIAAMVLVPWVVTDGVLALGLWVGLTVSSFGAAYYGKRGKPSGAIQHWLHRQELVPWWDLSLPGCLPAQELIYHPW